MTTRRPARPQALLFDWDNTLVDNWPVICAALNAALAAMGQSTWTLEETKARVRASLRDTFPRMFGDRWHEAEKIFYARFAETHLAELREMPGAGRLLARLADAGFTLAVVSNKRGGYLRSEAAHLGWAGHFHRLVGSGDASKDKPDAEPVRLALEGTAAQPGPAVWFVGDADIDLVCAIASGCLPVLLRDAPPAPEEFPGHRPALYMKSCAELADFIEKL